MKSINCQTIATKYVAVKRETKILFFSPRTLMCLERINRKMVDRKQKRKKREKKFCVEYVKINNERMSVMKSNVFNLQNIYDAYL